MSATPADVRERTFELDVVATVGLAVYSFVAALGYARVFGDWDFVGDVLLIVLVGHGLSFLFRRTRVHGAIAVGATVAAVGWTVAWLSYPDTFRLVFPTRVTWNVAWADLGLVRDQFQTAVAPVEYVGGWSLLAMIGIAFAVLAADTFAFRAHARGEALVPGAVLFVFIAALGADRHRVVLTLALVAAGFIAAALLRVRFTPVPRTVLGRSRSPLSLAVAPVALAASLVVLGSWVIGPRLPGASADALVDTSNDTGGVTEVLSPLVDIRGRLVNRSGTELFVVDADLPAYWRVSGLPQFDGTRWGLPDRALEDVSGDLAPPPPGSTQNHQVITISALESKFVPSAAEPVAASGDGLRWNAETSTILRVDRDLEPGDRFEVTSAMPSFTPDQLRATSSVAPPDPIYLELPDNFPNVVAQTAVQVTTGQPTVYDQMLALQTYFQTRFQYSLDVPQGHGNNAIEAFLRQRVGYCEQFAGTFAGMARSLGVPARVAVGFTPGVAQADGTHAVLGKNAHAWPEVWFDGLGWVPFEPTPGRGAPGAESYTGLAAAQDESIPGAAPATDAETAPLPTGSVPAFDPLIGNLNEPLFFPEDTGPRFRAELPSGGIDWSAVFMVLVVIGLLLLTPMAVRRWRRAHPSADVSRQIGALWTRALGAIEATGYRVDPSLTPVEQARAIAPRLPVVARPLMSLATATTTATYGPEEESAEVVADRPAGDAGPRRWCRQVEKVAADEMTLPGRIRRYFTVWA